MRADFCHLCTGCTYVEDMGRQESPHLIERKGQVDTDTQDTGRASRCCRQVISIPVSHCFQKCVDCAKARAKIIFLKHCLKRRYSSQGY